MSLQSTTNGKVVFITGASSGIGYYLSIEFSLRGYKVYAGARTISLIEPLQAKYGIIPIKLDVTSTDSIADAKETILSENNGQLDILYNNAGIAIVSTIFDIDQNDLQNSFDINVLGTINVLKAFQREIIKNKTLLAFTSSATQYFPSPYNANYILTKASFGKIPELISLETRQFGVKVIDVVTGAVDTKIWDTTEYKTPTDSVYSLGEDDEAFKKYGNFKQPVEEYSKQVVDDVEKALVGNALFVRTYRGTSAFKAMVLNSFTTFNWLSNVILERTGMKESFKKVADRYWSSS